MICKQPVEQISGHSDAPQLDVPHAATAPARRPDDVLDPWEPDDVARPTAERDPRGDTPPVVTRGVRGRSLFERQ
jgi:hypothetical protein